MLAGGYKNLHLRSAGELKPPLIKFDKSDDGKILVNCLTDCSQEAVIDAPKTRGLWMAWASNRAMRA